MAACSRSRYYPFSACELLVLRRGQAIDEARGLPRVIAAAEEDCYRSPRIAPTPVRHSN